jgi:hypothetical protein
MSVGVRIMANIASETFGFALSGWLLVRTPYCIVSKLRLLLEAAGSRTMSFKRPYRSDEANGQVEHGVLGMVVLVTTQPWFHGLTTSFSIGRVDRSNVIV